MTFSYVTITLRNTIKKQKDTKDIRNVTKRNPETARQFRDTTFYIILLISSLVT